MRRSRSDLLAVATALAAASSHDCVLVPITSITRYTPSLARGFLAMIVSSRIGCPRRGGRPVGTAASYARTFRLARSGAAACAVDDPSAIGVCRASEPRAQDVVD